jgi:hypothetical protein
MTERHFAFRSGARISGITAETAGTVLSAIEARDGVIRPAAVVDEARPADAPLHPAFVWDDTEAAERFRQEQARLIIRSVVVVSEERPDPVEGMRAFVHVSVPDDETIEDEDREPTRTYVVRVYIDTESAMRSSNLRAQVVAQALAELSALTRKYRELVELAEIFAAIDRAAQNSAGKEGTRYGDAEGRSGDPSAEVRPPRGGDHARRRLTPHLAPLG